MSVKGRSWNVDNDSNGNPIMLYGGDADLSTEHNGKKNYSLGTADKADKALGSHNKTVGLCGVNQTTGEIDPTLDIDKATGQTYAPNANYIIFRDIDLGSANWTPLTFQGTMIGAKLGANAATDARLWNDTEITAKEKPVISNVSVVQTGDLDVGKQMGVGFFATISSEVNENDIGLSKGLVKVSNLKIQKISVDNQSMTTKYDQSLINGLVTGLSQVLGGLLDALLWILSFGNLEAGLKDTLTKVLDARKQDPTALATGAIAGRVEGQVELSNIEVVNANVKNVNHNTGGFVGYVVGTTQYDGLSKALGGTAEILSKILNVIPGLGLGDLITILLGNVIKLDKLIPIAYINPTIDNCNIEELSLSTSKDKDFVGGFVGKQVGAIISNCAIKKSTFNVVGKDFVGGFVGLCRDSTIKGVLSDVGVAVNNLPKMKPESLLLNCQLNIDSLSVNGESYVGGFTGGLANSSAVNCSAVSSKSMDIHATGTYSGGFAGIATLGWAANLGKTDKTDSDLLGSVVKLVEGLLSSNPGEVSSLLSLAGVNPSYILGCTVNAPLTVMGTNYVGGITGWGDGLSIAPSSAEYASGAQISYSDVTKLKHTIVKAPDNLEDTSAPTYFNNESAYAVTGGRYAGGYVGDMDIGSAASVGGGLKVLGSAVSVTGILDALSVVVTTIEHSDVTGGTGGYAVLATGNLDSSNGKVGMAGGYAGGMYGGHIQDSQAVNFSYIIGEIAAGGYVGEMQPGDVAKLLKNASILDGLVNVNEVLASVLQSFVPSIRNSSTNCVPCGGAVRANAESDETVQRGMAGGYVGHNMGGTIHGFDTSLWFAEDGTSKAYNGPMSLCKAERIRSVYGHEYAGGYTGLMEPADTAKVGGLKVLGGLIKVNNILGALGVIYPVQTNTAVYGPLAGLDVQTWNSWVEYVGVHGGYGYELAQTGKVDRGIQKLMDELDDPLNEKKRQKIIEEADRKLDNLLQEHKQTAFAEKIMESAEADEKKIPLKKNIIHNIEMVVADYTSDRIAAAVDRVLISTDETDEKVLTRVVMKLLTDSEKETPTKKQKSKKKPLQTSDMVKFIIE